MSLSEDKLGKNSVLIANQYNKKHVEGTIYYTDEDELKENFKPLRKARINNKISHFFPAITDFFKTNQVDHIMVSGQTGCGKTTFIKEYAEHFKQKYPKARGLLFSSKKEDELLDTLKFIDRVDIDEDILVNPYTLEEMGSISKPSLIIFDDIQDFPNKKLNVEIARLRDEVMRNGRSSGLFSIYVNHDPCDYKATKSQIFEANKMVIFPKKCGMGTYNYLLEKKLHLNKKTIEAINTLKSNYVCINKNVPNSVISDNYILLL